MILCFNLQSLAAQFEVRRNIYEFNQNDRSELAELIIQYIDIEVIRKHCDYSEIMNLPPRTYNIHDDFNFLPFHRTYLEGLEDFLLEQGYHQYVPLPGWDGLTPPPLEFRTAGPNGDGVHPDCGNDGCTDVAGTCQQSSLIIWQNHTVTMPLDITLPPQSGLGNDLCDWDFTPTYYTPHNDNSGPNGISSQIETPWHNTGHSDFGGVMGNFRSPSAAIFWLWHAAVDDKWKEWECNCPQSTTLPYDLYMKDNEKVVSYERDRGEEPNIDEGPLWVSQDIWIRNEQDGSHQHQNPEYNNAMPNYAYVQVRNRGCVDSQAGEELSLYWTKAGSALSFPNDWNGTTFVPNSSTPLSGLIGTISLPAIPAGGSYIAEFEWDVPNPLDYDSLATLPDWWDNNNQHFCLLAIKEDSADDPMANISSNIAEFVKGNNNVVWKNISVVDLDPDNMFAPGEISPKLPIGATISVGDPEGHGGTYDIEFTNPRFFNGNPVTAEAEVRVTLDEPLWNIWQAGGAEMENVEIVKDEKFQLIIRESPARIRNLVFSPSERMLIKVEFNFLAKQLSGQEDFVFDVYQKENGTQKLIGGERYEIYIPGKEGFYADAGADQYISYGENAYLQAYDIGIPAIYNWYNEEGELIYEGKDFTISPEITEKYKLEVITDLDGLVDYDEIQVNVKEFDIYTMSPNPASDFIQIHYKADKANSAYFMIMQAYGQSYNHIINPQQDNVTISVANYSPGYYTVVLVADGNIVASEHLVIQ